MYPSQTIIFYDGLCGLCDKSVQFILEKDKHEQFLFCALQSNYAREVLGDKISFDSFILYDNGKTYTKSTGALLTLKKLGG
jgi:predicted DCC family thiol-disulfide oxidoreductase YuxK